MLGREPRGGVDPINFRTSETRALLLALRNNEDSIYMCAY